MKKVLSVDLDLITWTPRHPFRVLATLDIYQRTQDLLSTADLRRRKSYAHTFSSDCSWFQIGSPLTIFQSSDCPRLPSPEMCWQRSSCEHGVTARDDTSPPCLLQSVVAGWVTITMEVIISHRKWEHPLWTIYGVKPPRFPKCHKELPFPRYSSRLQWNPVRKY